MTEEIIIDGVDVSECDHLKYDHIGCDIDQTYCLGNDCYFKQLKRKEQECEKYKKGFEEDFAFNNELINDKLQIGLERNRYKQALDEIEKTINEDDFNLCPIDDSCDCHRGLEKDILAIINKVKEQ